MDTDYQRRRVRSEPYPWHFYTAIAAGAVLVELHDRRRQTIGVWLPVGDVARR